MLERSLRILLSVLLLGAWATVARAQNPESPRRETEKRSPESMPLLVSLFPESGKPTEQDRARSTALELRLREGLGPLLEQTPYGSVKVEVLANWDQAVTSLRRGGDTVVECDPVLYFSAVSSPENSRARYQIILQQIAPELPQAEVFVPKRSGLMHPEDLRGRRMGFVHRVAGGGAQLQRGLYDLGLSPNRDYQVWNARYVENAFLCLQADLVDAIAVPSKPAEEYLNTHPFPPVESLFSTAEFLPPLFAMRRDDLEGYPPLATAIVEGLRASLGSRNLVEARDDLYYTTRQESLPWEHSRIQW